MKKIDVKLIAQQRSIDESSQEIIEKAIKEGIETAWDRLEKQQPQCGFGQLGVCCNNCSMGPCRIDVFEEDGPQKVFAEQMLIPLSLATYWMTCW